MYNSVVLVFLITPNEHFGFNMNNKLIAKNIIYYYDQQFIYWMNLKRF